MSFSDQLEKLYACEESIKWVGNKTIEEAWETCENSEWMLWFLTKTDLDLTDPLCDIAEGVLHLVPEEHKLVCSNAISAARRRANYDELATAHDAAYCTCSASKAARYTAIYAFLAANDAAADYYTGGASYYASCIADIASAVVADSVNASSAANVVVNSAIYRKEQKKQCNIFRKYFTIDQVKEAFNRQPAAINLMGSRL